MSRNITIAELLDILAKALGERLAALGSDLPVAPRNGQIATGTAPKPCDGVQPCGLAGCEFEFGRQPWPPPAPGSHESDLDFDCPFTERNASAYRAHHAEYLIGFRWTRETKGTP